MTSPPDPPEAESDSAHADAATVAIPYPHREYVCPDCEREIPREQQHWLAKPAHAEAWLNDILKCPFCYAWFSPRTGDRTVVRIPISATAEVDVEEIGRLIETTTVVVPYPSRDYVCPECAHVIPTRAQIRLAKAAQHEHELNDILKCPKCRFLFSPKRMGALVLRG